MESINWDGGERRTVKKGDTLTCQALNSGQIYSIFLYNSSGADHDITVNVTTSMSTQPTAVKVPGTTADQGLASLVLVSGSDTSTVNVSISQSGSTSQDYVDAWIGSVQMPTNTSGLDNQHLDADGEKHSFNKYRRYYSVPASRWYQFTLNSNITQFISVQFQENLAAVLVANPTDPNNPAVNIHAIGSVTENKDYKIVTPKSGQPQTIQYDLVGNGRQFVWMNADSPQDSNECFISLQTI